MTTTQTRENGRARAQARQPQTLEEHLEWVEQLSEQGADLAPLAQGLLREKFQLEEALGEVRDIQAQLREQLEALTARQLYPAVITDASTRATGVVEVYGAGMTVKVSVLPDIAEDQLRRRPGHPGARAQLPARSALRAADLDRGRLL